MAQPTPQTCSHQGCHYNTPVGVPDWAGVIQLLQIHTQTAHPPPAPPPHGGDGGASNKEKLDKRPRPEATTNMSEHEFKFFQNEWNLYVRATQVQGQALVDELCSTMSAELRKLAYDQGGVEALTTQDQMMERIKSLAVSVLHTAVHTVSLHEAEQAPEESVKTFAARVRGIAANCELEKACA